MTAGVLAAIAAVILIATSRIPPGLLIFLVIVWLVAFNHLEPGVLAGIAGQAWELIGEAWANLPRTVERP